MVLFFIVLASCDDDETLPSRSYFMGFMNSAPRYDDLDLVLQSLALWTQRADAAIISTEVPWDSLLAGKIPSKLCIEQLQGIGDYYDNKDLTLWVYVDPQNGLDRTSDAIALQNAGRSIAEFEMQELYKLFVIAMDSILKPAHIGLALETNLIRDASPLAIYNGVKQAANDAAAELINRNTEAKISVSVQADHAWGRLDGSLIYNGIAQDFQDFPFIEEIGLSSYPYFGFDDPDQIPNNYYSKLLEGHPDSCLCFRGWLCVDNGCQCIYQLTSTAEKVHHPPRSVA